MGWRDLSLFVVLGIKPRTLDMLSKPPPTVSCTSAISMFDFTFESGSYQVPLTGLDLTWFTHLSLLACSGKCPLRAACPVSLFVPHWFNEA